MEQLTPIIIFAIVGLSKDYVEAVEILCGYIDFYI